MKIKNVTQTIKMTAMMIMPSASAVNQSMLQKMKEYASAPEDKKESVLAELIEMYPDKLKKDLEILGAKMPMDTVDTTLSLSSFLFDVYMSGIKPPLAPLALKIHEKKILDLAEKMKGVDEFEVTEEMMSVLMDIMQDDEKWQTAKIHVEVLAQNKEKLHIPLMHKVANLFPEVLEGAIKMVMEYMDAKRKADTEANQ
jgi:hypothetical protein